VCETPVKPPQETKAPVPEPAPKSPARPSTATKEEIAKVVLGNNRLALDLLRTAASDTTQNAFLSPWSITNALAMTWVGARGKTEAAMAKTLHFDLPQDRLHEAILGTNQVIEAGAGNAAWHVANRLWGDKSITFESAFLSTTKGFYAAKPGVADFRNNAPAEVEIINDWVEMNTEGRIRDILGPGDLDEETRLVLTNAVFFKGRWANTFDEDATIPREFHLTSSETKLVPTMAQNARFRYRDAGNAQVLQLDYQESELAMSVLLPSEGVTLAEYENGLTAEYLRMQLVYLTSSEKVVVQLPKFEFEQRTDLKGSLGALGVGPAFSERADFTGVTKTEPLMISKVIHKAYIKVDEEGTEAAAATLLGEAEGSVPIELNEFIANRPFLFLIGDRETGAVLFIGRVADPS
jgi:serpin B